MIKFLLQHRSSCRLIVPYGKASKAWVELHNYCFRWVVHFTSNSGPALWWIYQPKYQLTLPAFLRNICVCHAVLSVSTCSIARIALMWKAVHNVWKSDQLVEKIKRTKLVVQVDFITFCLYQVNSQKHTFFGKLCPHMPIGWRNEKWTTIFVSLLLKSIRSFSYYMNISHSHYTIKWL